VRGDSVCIPDGSRVPYIFRRSEGQGAYRNLGEAFVSGVMHGETEVGERHEEKIFNLI